MTVTFYAEQLLWRQTRRDGIAQAVRVLRRSILVINFHKLNIVELLEVQGDQIGDIEVSPIGHAGAFEEDMRDAITDFQPAVACKSVIERDPAKGESFCRARTFEIFIERGLM